MEVIVIFALSTFLFLLLSELFFFFRYLKQNLIDEEESHDRKREKKRKADKVKKAKEKQSVQDKLTEYKRNNAPSKTYTNLGGIENGIYNTRAIREDIIKNVAQAPVIQLTAASAVE